MTPTATHNHIEFVVENAAQEELAVYRIRCSDVATTTFQQADARSLVESLRALPPELFHVEAMYPRLGREFVRINELHLRKFVSETNHTKEKTT